MPISPKKDIRTAICATYSFPKNTRALALLDIHDAHIRQFILDAAAGIGFSCVVYTPDIARSTYPGYDICILDAHSDIDIQAMVRAQVAPILPVENIYKGILRDFDPMRAEGNAFLYHKNEKYAILEQVLRYLENSKYSADNNILLKNLKKTF
jgi:hypothetical protein